MAVYVLENSSDSEINIIKNNVSTIYDIGFNSIEFSFKYDFLKDKDYNG